MKYLMALFCPPLAMARSGKPNQAIAATIILILAVFLWKSGLGVIMAALTMMWASRVVGDRYATDELEEFMRLFHSTKTRNP